MHHLFHFDLKPKGNYGDAILFELVRQLFNGYGGREKFLVTGSTNLRQPVGPRKIAWVNGDFDAAVLGGGGLMLRSTNPNSNAGWQWNMPLSALEALEVPLIVFAIGYNRFEGEAEFDPLFTDHINATVEKSTFFALRNHGSIRQLQRYLRPELAEQVRYQPCPTTVASYLVPDLYVEDLEPERRVGLQVTFEARNELAGYRQDHVYGQLLIVAKELRRQGYELDVISHGMADDSYHGFLAENGVAARLVSLDGVHRGLYDGLAYYGRLPLTIGMRGHAQMIPFGMGNGIISVAARDKLRYFTDDIGHPELAVDPREGNWSTQVLDLVDDWFGDFAASRAGFATIREQLWHTSLDNLGIISRALTGDAGDPNSFVPSTPFERELAMNTYTSSALFDAEAERSATLRSELKATRSRLARTERALEDRENTIARGGWYVTYRNLRSRAGRLLRG
ncbi:MAG TPA: polysaccharide pyruvyl transferase family protein [Propionicimonas sp.]